MEGLEGLFVASPELQVAFDDVPSAVQTLLELDHGIECSVNWTFTVTGFLWHQKELNQPKVRRAEAAVRKRTQELVDEGVPLIVEDYADCQLSA